MASRYLRPTFFVVIGFFLFFNLGLAALESQVTVSTRSAKNITFNSAEAEGQIDPKGEGPTAYWLEWGPTDSLGRVTSRNIEPRIDKFDVTISLTGLNPNTKYYFRLVTETPRGKKFGSTRTLTTKEFEDIYKPLKPECDDKIDNDNDGLIDLKDPDCTSRTDTTERYSLLPVATTGDASLGQNNLFASVAAQVTLGRAAVTQVWFEWGETSQELLHRTPIREKSDFPSFSISEIVSNLEPKTTYYYRIMAVNEYGVSEGKIKQFKTKNAPPPTKQTTSPKPKNPPAGKNAPPPINSEASVPSGPLNIIPSTPILVTKNVKNTSTPNGATIATEAARGDTIRFTISVHNTGNQPVRNIFVEDRIPDKLDFLNLSPGSIYSRRTKKVIWWITNIEPQTSVKMNFSAKATQPIQDTLIENQATLIFENKQTSSNRAFLVIHTDASQFLARFQNNLKNPATAKMLPSKQAALLFETTNPPNLNQSSAVIGILALIAALITLFALRKNPNA